MILVSAGYRSFLFFFQAEDGIRDGHVTGVQTCALPILPSRMPTTITTAVARPSAVSERKKEADWGLSTENWRSEERRVGKECRYRWAPGHGQKKTESKDVVWRSSRRESRGRAIVAGEQT